MKQKGCKDTSNSYVVGKIVVVAVKASKDITKVPLLWALTHVVQPGDCIKFLVVIPSHNSSKRICDFSRFASDCITGRHKPLSRTSTDEKEDVVDSCSQMVLQLRNVYDPEKIKVRLKIVSSSPGGVVATEAKRIKSNWVILDKQLNYEKKCCMAELQCNIVVIKKCGPKVLRLNFINNPRMETEGVCSLMPEPESKPRLLKSKLEQSNMIRGPIVTPASSPEQESLLTRTDVGTSSMSSSSGVESSPFLLPGSHRNMKKEYTFALEGSNNFDESDSDTRSEKLSSYFTSSCSQPWMTDRLGSNGELSKNTTEGPERLYNKALLSTYGALLENLSKFDPEPDIGGRSYKLDLNLSRSVREAISLSKNFPLGHPPLCSVCQHKAPIFGNPPRWFTYAELELATGGFSHENFLAEGGFGSVFRGVLPDGQVVAVKQHKYASSQGDPEFCSEVEVLSCAQHRNVVMLIGFCVEDGRRLLVYEYICNGSLDLHLYGHGQKPLGWSARQKVAVGAARGLRYLHEECRVGCIVHRDIRPNNILLTHDFEPLVGDFGLARWQPDGSKEVETRVLGTFGYLGPEYAQCGQITEKADVYSFGVVLVELVTGRKAIDINRLMSSGICSKMAELENPKVMTKFITFISSLLQRVAESNDTLNSQLQTQLKISVFHGLTRPSISIQSYLERILKYANCSPSCYIVAYVYLDRFVQTQPSLPINSFTIHRLLITSVMVAAKFMDDMYYNNAYYAKVGGISTIEMNFLEVDFLFGLGFHLNVTPNTFFTYYTYLQREMLLLQPPLTVIDSSLSLENSLKVLSCFNEDETSHQNQQLVV